MRPRVLPADRIHGDHTTVPVLARTKTVTGRLWTYVRDDRPFDGSDPPAAMFFYSRDRGGEHPRRHLSGWAGTLQADAHAGFGELYQARRSPQPIAEAACWAHGRRKFFVLADLKQAPLATEWSAASMRSSPSSGKSTARRPRSGMPSDRNGSSRWSPHWKAGCAPNAPGCRATRTPPRAIDYMLKRWPAFTRFLDDGRICLTNNAAERALRGIALGRRAWLFAGSDRGGARAAAMLTLIETAKLNNTDPQAWLADVLRRINDHPAARLDELLPWNWKDRPAKMAA